ncbi:MAG: hypothetical protein ACK47Q_22675, partial [Dolichospermum sp.]
QGTGNREQGTGNREQGTGNREQGTGNREQGTGNREQGTGNRFCFLSNHRGHREHGENVKIICVHLRLIFDISS